MAKASKKDSVWLVSALKDINDGGKPVLVQGFSKSEIAGHWLWSSLGVECDLVMVQRRDGVLVSAEPFEPEKPIRVGYMGLLIVVSLFVILGVCFGS